MKKKPGSGCSSYKAIDCEGSCMPTKYAND